MATWLILSKMDVVELSSFRQQSCMSQSVRANFKCFTFSQSSNTGESWRAKCGGLGFCLFFGLRGFAVLLVTFGRLLNRRRCPNAPKELVSV